MVYVYHFIRDYDALLPSPVTMPFGDEAERARIALSLLVEGGHYELVATVEQTDLEHAWMVTNSIETCWSLEPAPGVTPTQPGVGRRSSCVGDVFQADGVNYVVSSCGFTELPVAG